MTAITVGTKVKIAKGLQSTYVTKGLSASVVEVVEMGAEWGHSVKVVLKMLNGFEAGKTKIFFARHKNRLADVSVRLNKGDPTKYIEIVRA